MFIFIIAEIIIIFDRFFFGFHFSFLILFIARLLSNSLICLFDLLCSTGFTRLRGNPYRLLLHLGTHEPVDGLLVCFDESFFVGVLEQAGEVGSNPSSGPAAQISAVL